MVHLEDIEPIGTHMTRGFGCRHREDGSHECTLDEWEVPTYPPTCAEAVTMRELRIIHSVTLGALAREIGVSVVDVSALERGQKRPAVPTTWDDLFAAVRRAGITGGV